MKQYTSDEKFHDYDVVCVDRSATTHGSDLN